MRPGEGRRPIISQSAPIASGPEHFQAKWNTWRLGKCDHTRIYSDVSPTARTTGPHFAISASITARTPAGSLCRTSAYREARGSRAVSVIASAQIWPMEFGKLSIIRSMCPAMISVPDAGTLAPGAGARYRTVFRVLAAPFGQSNCPTLGQRLPTTSHRIQATLFRAGLEEAD
jgi:hypothetical protein